MPDFNLVQRERDSFFVGRSRLLAPRRVGAANREKDVRPHAVAPASTQMARQRASALGDSIAAFQNASRSILPSLAFGQDRM